MRRLRHSLFPVALLLQIAQFSAGQPAIQTLPSAASTQLYFAQLADGGPAAQNWTVTVILNNPGTTAGTATANFFNGAGQPLPIDFGGGPSSTLIAILPAHGTISVTSTGRSSQTATGWGYVSANVPITGTVLYRATVNGTPMWDVAAAGTGPTYLYSSFATPLLGIAIVNPNSSQGTRVLVTAKDAQGNTIGNVTLSLGAGAQVPFNLGQKISTLSANFSGSITIISADSPPTPFVAWAVNSRSNLLSTLPPGEMLSPAGSPARMAQDVAAQVLPAILGIALTIPKTTLSSVPPEVIQGFSSSVQVVVTPSSTISASYTDDGFLHVSSAMLQLMGESRSAMAFMIGETVFYGLFQVYPPNGSKATIAIPTLVDMLTTGAMLSVGLDPSGPGDFLYRMRNAQLQGVPIDPSFVSNFDSAGNYDAHLSTFVTYQQQLCSTYFPALCTEAHTLWHPDVTGEGSLP